MNTAQDNVKLVKDFTAQGYESARKLGEINLQAMETFFEKQMDAVNLWLDAGVRQMELLADTKDVKTLATAQAELTKEFGETLMAKGRESLEAANKTRDAYRAWYETSVTTFTGKVEAATAKATKR